MGIVWPESLSVTSLCVFKACETPHEATPAPPLWPLTAVLGTQGRQTVYSQGTHLMELPNWITGIKPKFIRNY